MTNIIFLEADREDEVMIRRKYPEAKIISKALNGKELVRTCRDAEIISAFIYSKFPAKVLKELKKLKVLVTRSVGYNHIDVAFCRKQGITVCNVPDYGSHVIAEHVFALLLSTLRHINEADARVQSGQFDYHGLRGMALRGKTIGIIGTGRIGERVARIAHGFGMRILAVDTNRKIELEQEQKVQYVSFMDLLTQSNIVTLHAPAIPETHHMINDVALHRMKRGVVLVNTARGELIDTQALVAAIKGAKVGYALLDVLEHEKNFKENKELLELPNVVTTPHIGFYADDSVNNMYLDCFDSIDQWLNHEVPLHIVKPKTVVSLVPGGKKKAKKVAKVAKGKKGGKVVKKSRGKGRG